MYKYKKIKVFKEIEERINDSIICDNCKKIIGVYNGNMMDCIQFYSVCTSHNDWGRDSIDSISNREICYDCIQLELKQYLSRISETCSEKIEIEHTNESGYKSI